MGISVSEYGVKVRGLEVAAVCDAFEWRLEGACQGAHDAQKAELMKMQHAMEELLWVSD